MVVHGCEAACMGLGTVVQHALVPKVVGSLPRGRELLGLPEKLVLARKVVPVGGAGWVLWRAAGRRVPSACCFCAFRSIYHVLAVA